MSKHIYMRSKAVHSVQRSAPPPPLQAPKVFISFFSFFLSYCCVDSVQVLGPSSFLRLDYCQWVSLALIVK